jgi:hypothetical protein
MNLESDIEDLLNECHLTVRVNGILKLYEGIKQIKDLIYKDGSFVDNPKYIPNIGKKSAQEIDYMRRCFVKKYLTPHQENQSMNILVKNVDIELLRKQIHYMSQLLTENLYFQGSPLSGPNAAANGLEGILNLLETMYDTAKEDES